MNEQNTDTTKIKLQRKLGNEAAGEIEAKGPDDLRAHLAALALYEHETREAMAEDVALREAKEALATLRAPYAETLRGINTRRAYTALLLDESGAAPAGGGGDA